MSGSQPSAPLATTTTFSVSCSNPGSATTAFVTVNVSTTYSLSVTLKYETPGAPIAAGPYLVPDWAHAEEKPVPFVSIELQNASGVAVQQVFADANGLATFTGLDPAATYTPVVRSKAKSAALGLDFWVVDNTNPIDTTQPTFRSRYAAFWDIAAAYKPDKRAVAQSLLLTAPDGWDTQTSTLVDSMRIAAPFALLANAVTEAQIVSAAIGGSAIAWRPLTILWSTRNKGGLSAPPNRYDLGLVTSSGGFYSSSHGGIDAVGVASGAIVAEDYIFLSGDKTFEPMDIYPYAMAHEMGHFSQVQFSTLKSPGGGHRSGDYEDQTQAWIEGNASAIAALVMNTPLQNRIRPVSNQLTVQSYDVTTDLVNGTVRGGASVGWYSEDTVTRLIWQLYDPAGSIKLAPASVLAPMFGSTWKSGPWLNTVWAFLSQLKQLNPAKAVAIDTLADPLNLTSTGNDVWGSTETHAGNRISRDVLSPYTVIPIGGPPVSVCSFGQPLEYNKAGNVRYLRLTGDGNTHTLTVQGPSGTVPLLQRSLFAAGTSVFSTSGTVPAGGTVISVGDCAVALGQFSSDVAACNDPAPPTEQCWSVTLQ